MVVILILLSQFKQDILIMSANFVDVMLIDADTVSFLLTVFPGLAAKVAAVAGIVLPLLALFWWFDPYRVRLRTAALGAVVCLAALSALSLAVPMDREKAFESTDYVSQFARSGTLAVFDLATRGLMEADSAAIDRLSTAAPVSCTPGQRLPHIILVLDELSFDISAVPGVKVPPGYQSHFRSFDGKERTFLVEGAGGPTWYTEYNVLSGLSARSFGHFAEFVTRIAAGRVTRSLPNALRNCGYHTYSVYPWLGAFLSARNFQKTLGIEHFYDAKDLKTRDVEPDEFYYAFTADLLKRDHANGPMFVFTYLMANHFPVDLPLSRRAVAGLARPRQSRRERPSHRRISAPAGHERARLQGVHRAAEARFPERAVPDRALRRPSADVRQNDRRARSRRRRDRPAHRRRRSALLLHLLRHRHAEFQPGRSVVGASMGSMLPICRSSFWRRRACRSMRRLPSRSAFSAAATACSISAPVAPRRGGSTGC